MSRPAEPIERFLAPAQPMTTGGSGLDPVWPQLVTGEINIDFEFPAARMLQGMLARSFRQRPTPLRLEYCARELRELFLENLHLPAVRSDLGQIRRREAGHDG